MKTQIKNQMQIAFCVILLLSDVAGAQSSSLQRTWVFFRDKGAINLQSATPALLGISERALKRRAKVISPHRLIDQLDLPVAQEYLNQLRTLGVTVHSLSRWLNAASVEAAPSQVSLLRAQPFVASVMQVMVQKRSNPETNYEQQPFQKTNVDGINYGPSLTQHTRSKVVDVHALGINGTGVLLGMDDDGFNYHTTHAALKNLPVVAEYDFVQRDSNTSIAPGEFSSQGNHGEATLSIAAGFQNGNMIGAAYGVSVLLAKTEIDSVEITLEEDNYVEALEWMERLGVDIISTSLGYDDFDPAGIYNAGDIVYQMKDGRTGTTSLAGLIAARKGVLLLSAMGNEGWTKTDTIIQRNINGTVVKIVWGSKPGTGSILTPADADSIVSVGATDASGMLTSFSSTGPTADGRIKPEVVNQGSSVYFASGSTNAISVGAGTSFSTPLTAGAAALVLSAHPDLTPMQVREALMNTAQRDIMNDSRIGSLSYPNNYYGSGYVNALDAVLYWGLVFSNRPTITANDTAYIVSTKIKSKTSLIADSLFLFYKKASAGTYQRVALRATGTTDEYDAFVMKAEIDSTSIGYFSARDNSGSTRKNPFDAPDELFSLNPKNDTSKVVSQTPNGIPSKYVLRNFPNPFNPSTTLLVDMPNSEEAEIAVFNIMGQLIRTLFRGVLQSGTQQYRWNGVDERGMSVAAGMYIARLKTKSNILSTKLILLK
ncbi:MAG: S8 family peptidase [Ignavibacteriales bacterium]|nr:S8 family peptidase [Ignavibacteriales bacterium]